MNHSNLEETLLKPYCVAIVAKDKEPNSDVITFFNIEHLFLEEGKVDEIKEPIQVEVLDSQGNKKKIKAERTAVQEARWFSEGADGRQTAPDVVSGETVRIYKYGTSNVYYWKTIFREPSLRRLEHVVHAYSNLKSGRTAFELDSSYGNMFSTRDGKVLIWTSQSNGEQFSYQFHIDTRASLFSLSDNVSNGLGFNSLENKTWGRNALGSYWELDGLTYRLKATTVNFNSEQIHTTGSIHAGGPVIAAGFSIGTDNTDTGEAPSTTPVVFSRSSNQSRSKPWRSPLGENSLPNGVFAMGNGAIFETGVNGIFEFGDGTIFNFSEGSKIELEGSTLNVDQTSDIIIEGKSLKDWLKERNF